MLSSHMRCSPGGSSLLQTEVRPGTFGTSVRRSCAGTPNVNEAKKKCWYQSDGAPAASRHGHWGFPDGLRLLGMSVQSMTLRSIAFNRTFSGRLRRDEPPHMHSRASVLVRPNTERNGGIPKACSEHAVASFQHPHLSVSRRGCITELARHTADVRNN